MTTEKKERREVRQRNHKRENKILTKNLGETANKYHAKSAKHNKGHKAKTDRVAEFPTGH